MQSTWCRFLLAAAILGWASVPVWAQEEDREPLTQTQIEAYRLQVEESNARLDSVVKGLSTEEPLEPEEVPTEIQRTLKGYEDSAIPEVGKLLKHENWEVRNRAARWFASGHDDPQLAVDTLTTALTDPVWKVRFRAVVSCNYIIQETGIFIPELVALTNDPRKEVAQEAVEAICELGPRAIPVKDRLLEIFKNRGDDSYGTLAKTFGTFGPSGKEAVPYMKSSLVESYDSDGVAKSLGQVGARKELFEFLQHKDYMVRSYALTGLGWIPDADESVVSRLILATTTETEPTPLCNAVTSLGRIRPASEPASQAIAKLLNHEDAYLRSRAAKALGVIEPKFDSAVQALIAASTDEDSDVRDAAGESLSQYKMDPTTQAKVLIGKVIKDNEFGYGNDFRDRESEFHQPLLDIASDSENDASVRAAALYIVADMAKNYSSQVKDKKDSIIAQYRRYFADESLDPAVRGAAAVGLSYLGVDEEGVASGLVMAVNHSLPSFIRSSAASSIADERLSDQIPDLTAALKQEYPDAVIGICQALKRFESESADAVPVLSELAAQHPDQDVREAALDSIGGIATNLEEAIPVLIGLLSDEQAQLRTHAADSIREVVRESDADREPFVEPLHQLLLETDDWSEKISAIRALGALGPSALPAFETLMTYVDSDEDTTLRNYGVEAVGQLGDGAQSAEKRLIQLMDVDGAEDVALQALASLGVGTDHAMLRANRLLDDLSRRRFALKIIAGFGEQAGAAIPKLKEILENPETMEKHEVLEAIAAMGSTAKPLLPQVTAWMADESQFIQRIARVTAVELDPEDRSVVVAALASFDMEYGDRNAVRFLERFERKKVAEMLAWAMESDSESARANALKLLPSYSDSEQMADVWKRSLADTDPHVQLTAALKLIETGAVSMDLLPILVRGVTLDTDESWKVLQGLNRFGRQASGAIADAIVEGEHTGEVRLRLHQALAGIFSNHSFVARFKLQRAMKELPDSAPDKLWITMAWASLIPGQRGAVVEPEILSALQSEDRWLRKAALQVVANHSTHTGELPDVIANRLLQNIVAGDHELVQEFSYLFSYYQPNHEHESMIIDLLGKHPRLGLAIVSQKKFTPEIVAKVMKIFMEQEDMRYDARRAMYNQDFDTTELIGIFADSDADSELRTMVADLLCTLKAPPTQHVDRVHAVLKEEGEFQTWAAVMLARWGQCDEAVMAGLIDVFSGDPYDGPSRYLAEVRESFPKENRAAFASKLETFLSSEQTPVALVAASGFFLEFSSDRTKACQTVVELMLGADDSTAGEFAYALQTHRQEALPVVLDHARKQGVTVLVLDYLRGFIWRTDLEATLKQQVLECVQLGMKSEDELVVQQAATMVPFLDPTDSQAESVLLKQLQDGSQDYEVAAALGRLDTLSESTVKTLIELLDRPDQMDVVLQVLAEADADATPAVPKLLERLEDPRYRNSVYRTLSQLKSHAKQAIPTLLKKLDVDSEMADAASALSGMGPEAAAAVPVLSSHLSDPDKRYSAVLAMGALGESGRTAVPVLTQLFRSPDSELVLMAVRSVQQLGFDSPDVVSQLDAISRHQEPIIRESVARALGHVNSVDLVMPTVVKLLEDQDFLTRQAANQVVRHFGPKSAAAVPVLTRQLGSARHSQEVLQVVLSLESIGPAAIQAVPELRAALDSLDSADGESLRSHLIGAIWTIDPATAKEMKLEPETRSDQ